MTNIQINLREERSQQDFLLAGLMLIMGIGAFMALHGMLLPTLWHALAYSVGLSPFGAVVLHARPRWMQLGFIGLFVTAVFLLAL